LSVSGEKHKAQGSVRIEQTGAFAASQLKRKRLVGEEGIHTHVKGRKTTFFLLLCYEHIRTYNSGVNGKKSRT